MPCERCASEGARPNSMSNSWQLFVPPCCKVPSSTDLVLNCGHSSVWARSSSACTAFALARRRFGASWAHWDLARKSPRSGPSSATRMQCATGSAAPGRALKKSPTRRPTDCLRGRVWHQRAPDQSPHLGAQGTDADHPVSLQLESCLGHRRTHAYQLFVPAARRKHQEGGDRRISQSAQGRPEAAAAGDLGWPEGASESFGTRVPGQPGRTHPDRVPATVRAGHEPGRIPVGLAEAPRTGQLLPQRSRRTARERPQQAQERSKAALDHCCLLDAGYAVVTS